MCIGRSRYFDAAVSARCRSAGPRSIVSVGDQHGGDERHEEPEHAQHGMTARRVGRRRGGCRRGLGSLRLLRGGQGSRLGHDRHSITTSTRAGLDRVPAVDRHFLDPCRPWANAARFPSSSLRRPRRRCRAATSSPAATSTRTTRPGIGATTAARRPRGAGVRRRRGDAAAVDDDRAHDGPSRYARSSPRTLPGAS